VRVERRGFLRGTAAALGGATVGAACPADARATVTASATGSGDSSTAGRVVPFHGAHQAGIVTPRQPSSAFVSFDLTAGSRRELAELMQTLTARVRWLTRGGVPPELGISAPPADSGTLGAAVPADGLTVTVGLGAGAFAERFGTAGDKPRLLRPMDTFPDDQLDPARCHGDLLLQICADHSDTVLHALRDLTRHTRGAMQPRWRVGGFNSPSRPDGAPRNHLGFKDGSTNPSTTDPSAMDELVWAGSGEPAWARGGSYQVVRVIRTLVEFWDRVTISEQERMIGRRRGSGAPLSGSVETDVPDYTADPMGSTIPLDAHIRMANPRTTQSASSQLLRRGYNYDSGLDVNGNLDMGLIFACYQADLDRQFVAVQRRLAGEPLTDYIAPVGGGYFYAVPGVRDRSDWFASDLLA